jgi:hypothetical protein
MKEKKSEKEESRKENKIQHAKTQAWLPSPCN